MVLAATEGAAQILTARVAGMREEADPAVPAAHQATGQIGTVPQNGVERDLILTNKRTSAIILMPILGKGENALDAYDKGIRLCVMIRIVLAISSSYVLDAQTPRGGRGFFSAFEPTLHRVSRAPTPRRTAPPAPTAYQAQPNSCVPF
jgi:hypothetical protein